jgi:hypothetical protein
MSAHLRSKMGSKRNLPFGLGYRKGRPEAALKRRLLWSYEAE